ncbi:MAG: hypothetical protein AAFP79_05120 [Pseudomonadota bacterium]
MPAPRNASDALTRAVIAAAAVCGVCLATDIAAHIFTNSPTWAKVSQGEKP